MARLKVGESEVETFSVHIGGTEYLLGLGAIQEIGWYNITLLDTEAIVGPRHLVPFSLLLFVALLLLSLAFIGLLNKFVFQRICRLDAFAQNLEKGADFNFTGSHRQDEMGRLEHSFEQMAASIRGQAKTLEDKVDERTRELALKNEQLTQALSEIKTLSGLLPICMYCKEIRNDKGAWTQLEEYIAEHSDAEFSHGICDKCGEQRFGKIKGE